MSHMEHSQRSSTVEGSTTTRSTAARIKATASKKAAAEKAAQQQNSQQDQQIHVKDPEDNTIDRTPKTLNKKQPTKMLKRGIAQNVDRRTSVATGEGSVSVRTSQSEENSMMEGSSSSNNDISTVSGEDSTTFIPDESSDSHSTYERSTTSYIDKRRPSAVSSHGDSIAESVDRPDKQHQKHGKDHHHQQDKHHALKEQQEKDRAPVVKEWTPEQKREWRQQEVVVTLQETPMMWLFEKKDELVHTQFQPEEAHNAKKRNERYLKFCEARKDGESGGRYVGRGMTTLNDPCYVQWNESHLPRTHDSGRLNVTTWKLHDEMGHNLEEDAEAEETQQVRNDGGDAGSGDDEANDAGGDDNDHEGGGGGDNGEGTGKRSAPWLRAASLLENVMVVERCIVQNTFEELQMSYRGLGMEALKDAVPTHLIKVTSPTETKKRKDNYAGFMAQEEEKPRKEEEKETDKPKGDEPNSASAHQRAKMRKLWRYGNEMTKGKNISCMSWNKVNSDILAAGYGEYGIPGVGGGQYGGFVCCWSPMNPVAPERVIEIQSEAGVSALSFSENHGSMLAVGNTDGTLALYDVRKHGNTPALQTTVSTGQHTGTIWEVQWVSKGKEAGASENLVSISADGHVYEWSIKKGLERTTDLMKLKRVTNRDKDQPGHAFNKGANKEAPLAREAGGMCFDINPREQITYVVGTEDGTIHRCSKSQNESFQLDYKPHEEPVYRVRWSKANPQYFLTCSADWTSRLYHIDEVNPKIVFDSNKQDAVQDLAWSPVNCSIFATATAHGRVELWDIADPITYRSYIELEDRCLNSVLFAKQDSPLLTVGDNCGDVTVIKLTGHQFEGSGQPITEQGSKFEEYVRGATQ